MAVYPSSFAIALGLGGSFLNHLLDTPNVRGCWSLAETRQSRAYDLSGRRNHGTYTGALTRGVTVPLPEGMLGVDFSDGGYVTMGNDADLNLEGGSIEAIAIFRTSTNDANVRTIVQKMETGTGYGWRIGLESGAIRVKAENAGGLLFDLTKGSGYADGNWHTLWIGWEPDTGDLKVYVDGAQAGTTATGLTTELEANTGHCRIADWGGVANNHWDGDLSLVLIGRDPRPTVPAILDATWDWTDVTADVRALEPIRCKYGISGRGPLDRVPSTGTLSFGLDNSTLNSGGLVGYYSPGHANCRSGFDLSIPVRYSETYAGTTYYKFRGSIKSIRPVPGAAGVRMTSVLATDWIDFAASEYPATLATQIDQMSDDVFGYVVDQAARPPVAVSIGTGSSEFPYALDNTRSEQTVLQQEFARICASELGFAYIKGDTTQGGTLVYEGRGERQLKYQNDHTFTDTFHGMELTFDRVDLVNKIRTVVYPRQADAAPSVLFQVQGEQFIEPLGTLVIEGQYRDPGEIDARIGAVSVIDPVANTDYVFNDQPDNSGEDHTADVEVIAEAGANAVRLTLINNDSNSRIYISGTSGAVFLRVRGTLVYDRNPIIVTNQDGDSVRKHGPHTLTFDMPYQTQADLGDSVGRFVLATLSDPYAVVRSVSLLANHSATLMTQALAREVGDRIGIEETVTGVSEDIEDAPDSERGYFIQSVDLTREPGGILRVTWGLAPDDPGGGVWVMGVSVFGESTRLAF